ncbi:MAG: hypothetical protein E7504_07135 [Ruminococcus sp.]|nr:hypothetical protein [Ruminococcus sp.]
MQLNKMDSLMRIIRVRIDSAEDIGFLIICIAIGFAMWYFLPKFFPDITEKKLKIILCITGVVLGIIWVAIVGG